MLLVTIVLAAILGTMWALGFIWAAFRVAGVWEKLLSAALSLPGFLVILPTYFVLGLVIRNWPGFIGGFGFEAPHLNSPVILAYLAGIGVLAVIVAIRRVRGKVQGRA